MRSSSPLRLILPAIVFAASTFSQAAVQVQSRIASVNTTSRAAVPHTVSSRALAGADLGEVSEDRKLDSLMISFNMTDAQQAALTQLLIDQQNPSSPRYHQWLTPEQFGAQFGISAADIAKVSAWLTSQGFIITGTAHTSNFITFDGTAAQVKQAFGSSIHNVMVDGEAHISNLTDPVLPAGIAAVVTSVEGLNDLKLKARARPRTVQAPLADPSGIHANFTSSIAPGNHYIAPGDFYTIYNEAPLLTASTPINGKGITVVIVGQTNISTSDVTAFRTASGLGAYCYTTLASGQTLTSTTNSCSSQALPIFATNLVGSNPGISSGDLPEAMLDVEWAGATAPGANIVYVNSTNVFTSLTQAASINIAPIISISYGLCELFASPSLVASMNQAFQMANAMGETIVGPSGDSGATDCDANVPAVNGLSVDFPASSPYVTAAGGSMFNDGTATGATTYWGASSTNNTNGGSALGYIPEIPWNESSVSGGLGAGGGGFSLYFAKPYWQVGTGVPNDSARDLPDISLNSASNHDGTLYCASGSCVTGFRGSDGQSLSVVGGTSVAAPSFAGVLALVEQKTGARIGNAGPVLYALANVANVYHDITTGNINSACVTGTDNCTSGTIGYSAGVGYDLATGLGSVNVANMVNNWTAAAVPVGPANASPILTTTAITTASQTCGVANGTLALTIRVAPSTGTGTPTGNIQLLVDNVAIGSPLPLVSGSVTTNFVPGTYSISSGFHIISALYSGDATYAASKFSITDNVVSSTKPDFTFTLPSPNFCVASASARAGAAASAVTLTITPVNNFTGTVTFTAVSDSSPAHITYSFAPATLTFTSATSATTTLTLTASASSTGTNTLLRQGTNTSQQTPLYAPWYLTGSGAALGCIVLVIAPRRRRWAALVAVILSVAVLSASGCSSSSSTVTGGGTTTTGTTNATAGSYDVQVIATSTTSTGTVSHLVDVILTVQ